MTLRKHVKKRLETNHIQNALREELAGESVVAKFATPKNYGRREGLRGNIFHESWFYSLFSLEKERWKAAAKKEDDCCHPPGPEPESPAYSSAVQIYDFFLTYSPPED